VNRALGPLFKISNTGLKLKDSVLHGPDLPLVEQIFSPSDKPKIARRIPAIDINSVKFQLGNIPPFQGDDIGQESAAVCPPKFKDMDASAAVMLKG
jgi:hypothetical protein